MKPLQRCLFFALAACLLAAACRLPQEARVASVPRVLRVLATNDIGQWRFSINGGAQSTVSRARLKDRIAEIALQYGDLVVCENALWLESNAAKDAIRWLEGVCKSNGSAFYACSAIDVGDDVFSVPVYHWVAPSSSPNKMDSAAFFFEGVPLGRGNDGYTNMLNKLERSCPPKVFVLGSAIDFKHYEGPPEPRPYMSRQAELTRVLEKCGSKQLFLTELSALPP